MCKMRKKCKMHGIYGVYVQNVQHSKMHTQNARNKVYAQTAQKNQNLKKSDFQIFLTDFLKMEARPKKSLLTFGGREKNLEVGYFFNF